MSKKTNWDMMKKYCDILNWKFQVVYFQFFYFKISIVQTFEINPYSIDLYL